MKRYVFELKTPLWDMAFGSGLMKERTDLLLVVLEACRYMMYNQPVRNAQNKLMLVVNDMSRLFFCTRNKMFSVVFPFHVDDYSSIQYDYNQLPVDSKMLSDISRFLESNEYRMADALDFITPIEDILERGDPDIWIITKHLLTYDIGYVRYDDDIEGFKKASKEGRPQRHPRYHYDVNINSKATFKLGLQSQLTPDKFVDFLDNNKDRPVLRT